MVSIREQNMPSNNWMTKGLCISYNRLRSLYNEKRRNNSKTLKLYITKYEKIYQKLVGEAKRFHNNRKLKNSSNKNKQMWTLINNETKQYKKMVNHKLKMNGTLTDNYETMANEFNKFFTTVLFKNSRKNHCK